MQRPVEPVVPAPRPDVDRAPTSDHVARARAEYQASERRQPTVAAVAGSLVKDPFLTSSSLRDADRRYGLAPVAADILDYQRQARLLGDNGLEFPCAVPASGDIPIPVLLGARELVDLVGRPPSGYVDTSAPAVPVDLGEEVQGFKVSDVHSFLLARLLRFLGNRPPRPPDRPGLPSGGGGRPHFQFTVECPTPGRRVHVSPVYALRENGASQAWGDNLTSPVVDELAPGIWIFGSRWPGQKVDWDLLTDYRVPHDECAILPAAGS